MKADYHLIKSNPNLWLVFSKNIPTEVDPQNIEVFRHSRLYLYENRIIQFGNIYPIKEKRVCEKTIQIFSLRLRNVHMPPLFSISRIYIACYNLFVLRLTLANTETMKISEMGKIVGFWILKYYWFTQAVMTGCSMAYSSKGKLFIFTFLLVIFTVWQPGDKAKCKLIMIEKEAVIKRNGRIFAICQDNRRKKLAINLCKRSPSR